MNHGKEQQEKKVYIIEEQKIVSLDLYRQLQKKGFNVVHENSVAAMNKASIEEKSKVVITNLRLLNEDQVKKGFNTVDIIDRTSNFSSTDTLVMDYQMNIIKHFKKPFDTAAVEDFLNTHFGLQ